jgi:hypothetical protein
MYHPTGEAVKEVNPSTSIHYLNALPNFLLTKSINTIICTWLPESPQALRYTGYHWIPSGSASQDNSNYGKHMFSEEFKTWHINGYGI